MPERRRPRPLFPGACLGVVSPASPIDPDLLEKGLAHFHERGYRTKVFPHALAHRFYLAGTDEERAQDLTAAFLDPEVDAVLCTRGGYGCARLLPYLDFDALASTGKTLLGFSDVTTLHLALNRRGIVTFHTPMVLTLAYDRAPFVFESLWSHLEGKPVWPADAPKPSTVIPGVAEGELVGGCLCLLSDSIGTPFELETDGKILVIEDVDEAPHRVDAMFTQLLNTGKLQACAGVLVGEMTRTEDRTDPTIGTMDWREIVRDRLLQAGVPSILDFPFGHHSNMLSLALGVRARLDADAGTLEYLEPLCES